MLNFLKQKPHRPLLVIALSVSAFLFYVSAQQNLTPTPEIKGNIFIDDLRVSGLTYDQAAENLQTAYKTLRNRKLLFVLNDQNYEFSAEELGIELDTFKTMEAVYLVSQGDNLWQGAANTLSAIFEDLHIKPIIFVDEHNIKQQLVQKIPDLKKVSDMKIKVGNNEHKNFQAAIQAALFAEEESSIEIIPEEELSGEAISEEPPAKKITRVEPPSEKQSTQPTPDQIYVEQPFTFKYNDGQEDKVFLIRFTKDWIDFTTPDENSLYRKILKEKLAEYIQNNIASTINVASQNAMLKSLPKPGSDYAEVEGIAKKGRAVDVTKSVQTFYDSIAQNIHEADLIVKEIPGRIINETGQDLGKLELLGSGLSNFATSPEGRDFNVRKGLREKVNNIMVAPDSEYNYNKNLGSITLAAGWKKSLAIFGGSRLVPVPGGGLCQVSTTTYRAAVAAGLPILEQYNHSLYVHYYVKYADGIDSTIYPGVKNLRFKNDTGNWLLLQAYDDGYDAYVNIYGTSDGRQVDLIGPFYADEAISDAYQDKIQLKGNQIGWLQIIKRPDGSTEEKNLISTYKQLNKSYRQKYN